MRNSNITSFTLIELLVVIAITGVVAGVFVGTLRFLYPSWALKGAVRELGTELRLAQQSAVTEQINYGVRFSTTTNQYQVLRYTSPVQVVSTKFLPQDISFYKIEGFINDEVLFNNYGGVQAMGTSTLANTKGEKRVVQVRPSGFVKIK